jgi:hypothetical protein
MVKSDIKCLERGIQDLNSAVWQINEAMKDIHDNESKNVLSIATQMINSIVNKTSEEMNNRILEEENNFKNEQKCQKPGRCFICGKREYGGCPA